MKSDYRQEEVDSCLSVLVELMTILRPFRDNIVLVGGWTPWFLIPEKRKEHTGSLDIDVALDFKHLDQTAYKTILRLLKERGYEQGEQPFIFYRNSQTPSGKNIPIEIDFLAGEYGGTSKSHRTQRVQDIRARKARGCDLVFDDSIAVVLEGTMPDGARNKITIRIPGVVPFIVTKAMALWESYKEKHAYDIYFVLKNYPGGIEALAERFKPYLSNTLVKEGLEKIGSQFSSLESAGPVWVASFLEVSDREEKERFKRDAFERVRALMAKLEISNFEIEPSR